MWYSNNYMLVIKLLAKHLAIVVNKHHTNLEILSICNKFLIYILANFALLGCTTL